MELTNYAIARGFNWKYLKNDSVRLTVRCNVSVCPWRLHASVVHEGPQFAIKSLNNIHSCGCDIMSDGHPRTSKKWVANAVKGKLVDKPTYRASEMMRDIRRDYGISIPYHQNKLSYVELIQRTCITVKPGIGFAFAYGFEVGCRPMLFLDGTHIKQHRVQGVILAASALNGNNELFTVAYSIEDSETYDNCVWFLQNLKKALLSYRRIAFLSDRGKGLKEAIPDIFPNDHHGYCFQHIMQNLTINVWGNMPPLSRNYLEKFSSLLPMLLLNKSTKTQ
ncbi:hypothetical protein Taro_050358 [Colocasia esculenta]|uniref:MULE transposase domain-containing protein n=1 Tax=Colocasia esculenta TaxID=4460 RepID=A0A843XD74_COLES|nr:hypothetical protein [Colocasia esculenta]